MPPLPTSGPRSRKPRAHGVAELRLRPRCAGVARTSPLPLTCPARRGRLVDYGAALEMRFGATRRGFESRPLRQNAGRRNDDPGVGDSGPRSRTPRCARSGPRHRLGLVAPSAGATTFSIGPFSSRAVDFPGRARRGTSGALNLQSAPAGLNSHPRTASLQAAASSDVEDRVPRSDEPRTVSGPEGSSTKRSSSGAAEWPGPSRSLRWARERSGRRRVHGIRLRPSRGIS